MLQRTPTRRAFLLAGLAFPPFSWFRPGPVRLCGAEFDVVRGRRGGTRFLVIHGDELTAKQVLRSWLLQERGRGRGLVVRGETRLISVLDGRVDPNRIFSGPGAERSLRRSNPCWPEERLQSALAWLEARRERAIQRILPPRGRLLCALHNNSRGYSVRTELPLSEKFWLPRLESEPQNFYLCTTESDFAVLRESPYNAVLQRGTLGEDDGSLSRLCASRDIRYLNLETRLGDFNSQLEMLRWAAARLPE